MNVDDVKLKIMEMQVKPLKEEVEIQTTTKLGMAEEVDESFNMI